MSLASTFSFLPSFARVDGREGDSNPPRVWLAEGERERFELLVYLPSCLLDH
jgi:hypothetical protein